MNNTIEFIGKLFGAIKNTFVVITMFVGLFTNTTSSPTSIVKNIIPESKIQTALKNTEQIIGTLSQGNISTSTDVITEIPKKADQMIQATKKLSQLNLVAPNHEYFFGNKGKVIVKTPATTTPNLNKEILINTEGSIDSVVNIRCEKKVGNSLKVITGSGVLINETGLILTAAHVAAPVYARENGGTYKCFSRVKDPATGNYPIKLVFIDKNWINKYYYEFDKTHTETGEFDIALLQIDNSKEIKDTDIALLNGQSHSSLSISVPKIGDSILIESYPADDYGKYGVFMVLPRKTEVGSIGQLFNFNNDGSSTFDLIETEPSSLGQSGASGGGIFNDQGQLIGIISNSVTSNILLKNKIRALSIKYIDKEIKNLTGKSLSDY